MNLKGKIAVVIGSTGGIGREIVNQLDMEGAQLVLVSKNEPELQNQIKKLKNKAVSFAVDLSDQKLVEKIIKKVSDDFPKIDLLINAAGIGIYKTLEDITLDEWNKSININLNSVFITIKGLINSLNSADNSIVINLGSGMGVKGEATRSAYCTSKFALRGLTLTLAEEYKRFEKPEFCLLTLGSVLTSFGPMSFEEKRRDMENGKGYLTPDWVAKKIVELVKLDSRDTEYHFSSPDYNKP